MNLDLVIQQLRLHAPMFQGRVAGAADFRKSLATEVAMVLPAAYVVPLDEDANENTLSNALNQLVTEHIGVVVEFDNSTDRRGQSVTSLYDATRAQIWASILNWRVDPVRATRGLEASGARNLDSDHARLFYQWEFSLVITISDADGWQIPVDPLLEMDFSLQNRGRRLVGDRILLPQT